MTIGVLWIEMSLYILIVVKLTTVNIKYKWIDKKSIIIRCVAGFGKQQRFVSYISNV